MGCDSYAVETTCKLNVHKMLRRCPGRLLNGRLLNNLRPLSNVQLNVRPHFQSSGNDFWYIHYRPIKRAI